ncbi:MAG: aminotransferase class I/II-fold pyridoxal phosphate-dependent enzyme, partial [Candidatus Brocadiae bacterium]|nr:aminotransferase class I/II-fold pyridoxal phosphate-dependent enzyme [Candidatus Brocadiia bacterium]
PAAAAAAALAALRLVQSRPADRERLGDNTRRLRAGLAAAGIPAPGDPRIPIVPVPVGSNADAVAAGEFLLRRGVFVHPIRPPAVPAGTARLRITVTAAHTPAQVDSLLDALSSLPSLRS